MNIHVLLKKIRNNEMTIDKCGHIISEKYALQEIDRSLSFFVEYFTKMVNDGDEHGQKMLDVIESEDAYIPGESYMKGLDQSIQCGCCGHGYQKGKKHSLLKLGIKDDNTFEIVSIDGKRFECEVESKPIVTEIDINSGLLVFANHFGQEVNDAPPEEQHSAKYSINALIGRINCAKYLAGQNYGYGQMGNSSVSIYMSDDKKSIKIIDCGVEYHMEEYEYLLEDSKEPITKHAKKMYLQCVELLKTHDYIGQISMCVWRWMCADKTVCADTDMSDENFEVEVEPGRWEITHNHDYDRDALFASEMRLL